MADARGFWIKQHGQLQLCWCIDGEFVTDKALRRWVWHNVPGIMRYVDVIRQCQCDAYTNRHRSMSAIQ